MQVTVDYITEAGFNTAYESKFMKSTVISSGATGLTIELYGQNNQYKYND